MIHNILKKILKLSNSKIFTITLQKFYFFEIVFRIIQI